MQTRATIFLVGTITGLEVHRARVAEYLYRLGVLPVDLMSREGSGGPAQTVADHSFDNVDKCEAIVAIEGSYAGNMLMEDGRSLCEEELTRALNSDDPIPVFVYRLNPALRREQTFFADLLDQQPRLARKARVTDRYDEPDELGAKVVAQVGKWLLRSSPWRQKFRIGAALIWLRLISVIPAWIALFMALCCFAAVTALTAELIHLDAAMDRTKGQLDASNRQVEEQQKQIKKLTDRADKADQETARARAEQAAAIEKDKRDEKERQARVDARLEEVEAKDPSAMLQGIEGRIAALETTGYKPNSRACLPDTLAGGHGTPQGITVPSREATATCRTSLQKYGGPLQAAERAANQIQWKVGDFRCQCRVKAP